MKDIITSDIWAEPTPMAQAAAHAAPAAGNPVAAIVLALPLAVAVTSLAVVEGGLSGWLAVPMFMVCSSALIVGILCAQTLRRKRTV